MKKTIALLLTVIMLLSFVGCRRSVKYENVTYRESGIEFTLPSSMRRSYVEGYDYYFSTLAIIFTAVKIDSEFIESSEIDLDPSISAKEYVDLITEEMDKSQMYFNVDESRNLYNFRYTYEDQSSGTEIFYYVIVIGESGNTWYIEMCCDQQDSGTFVETFDEWKMSIKTYNS